MRPVLETISSLRRYLPYAIGVSASYILRPPIEALARWFHELGHGLYQWVGTSFSEFPRIVFFNKYMVAYSPWLGNKVLPYGKNLFRALLGSHVDPIVGSAAPPSEGYWRFLHDHPLHYGCYSAPGPLFAIAYSMAIMLAGFKVMKNGHPLCQLAGVILIMIALFSYIPEAAWAIGMGQDYQIMDYYASPMDDIVKLFVVFFLPWLLLRKTGYELLRRVSRLLKWSVVLNLCASTIC